MSQVRRANLAGCNYLTYLCRKDAHFGMLKMHQDCVKKTAVESLARTRFISEQVARDSVDRWGNFALKNVPNS